jgi:catechol 2,3-dioxygenase-like lactoylglutathione lyase family enzyme
MKGINHLVLAAHDLDEIRRLYADLGFTLTAPGQHPFGTGNTIIQLHGTYLELLAVTRPQDIVEHSAEDFSFSAFNRDYLVRHEGFSMMVLETDDAEADRADWAARGHNTYAPFQFSRQARLPDGQDVTVGFALAFTSVPDAPWLGLFACQHFRPDYYAQPQFMSHRNGAQRVMDVWIAGPGALDLSAYLSAVCASAPRQEAPGRIVIPTRYGDIVLSSDDEFRAAFGAGPPHPEDGPHLAALTIACDAAATVPSGLVRPVGPRLVVPPSLGVGTAIGFCRTP